jgi:Ser/Thr protein kinase RdoA (MazF antagonist)
LGVFNPSSCNIHKPKQEQDLNKKGSLLAEGRTSEIFAWGTDQVLKLYREGWSPKSAPYEYSQALASQKTGYRVPKVGELVEIEGRQGITYQRIEGRTMLQEMVKKPWKLRLFGRQQALLHAEMHKHSATDLPLVNDRLAQKIQNINHLDQAVKSEILKRLATLPQDDKLLHGDFHPGNIMLTADGPVIIDWIDAALGHPLADLARTLVLFRVGEPPENLHIRLADKFFMRPYLPIYFQHSPYSPEDLEAWMLPVAAARLEENISHEIKPLIRMVHQLLAT